MDVGKEVTHKKLILRGFLGKKSWRMCQDGLGT